MNGNVIAKQYVRLTPEERFRLILAASGRGDEAEYDRLVNAGGRICLTMSDHAPFSHAFEELALLVFIELLEDAARYLEAFDRADHYLDSCRVEDAEEERETGGASDQGEDDAVEAEGTGSSGDGDQKTKPAWVRRLELAYAHGYVLRAKAGGWGLFCKRMCVPPFLLWEGFPGFDRVQRGLALAGECAFDSEGFVRWLNGVRRAGEQRLTEAPLTVEGVADATEKMFRGQVEWWGG